MPLLRPIQRDEYIRGSADIEALKLWTLKQGAYLDNGAPVVGRTALGILTAGVRVSGKGGIKIRGGVI